MVGIASTLLMLGIIITLAVLVLITMERRMSIVQRVSDNFDGSYTVTVSVKNPNQLRKNPKQLKIAIKEGKALFLKKPELNSMETKPFETLFVVVVNESTIIELCFGRKKIIISGEAIANNKQKST